MSSLISDDQPNDLDTTDHENLINVWLRSLGLHFNPFFALNASDDPHLSEYLIELEVFDAVWGDGVSFVFESAGGGKTALRVRTSQACWNTHDINRPFPIPYNPPFLKWGTVSPSYHNHLEELSIAGTEQLLLGLSHRPQWFLTLRPNIQQRICELLTWGLSAESLEYYLDELHETYDLQALQQEIDPTFKASDPPTSKLLQDFCETLSGLINKFSPPPDDPTVLWDSLCSLLLDGLRFPAIYLLLDGLDATLETATDPHLVISTVEPLLSLHSDWVQRNIFIKGFLPIETKQVFKTQFPEILSQARIASITWHTENLAELVRQRVYVASEGQFRSLDAIVTPGLRDFEDILIETIVALRPREILTLINEVFAAHIRHGKLGKIEERDWLESLNIYKHNAFQQTHFKSLSQMDKPASAF